MYQVVTDYIKDARTLLQDTIIPYRYDDDSLVVALNAAMLDGRRLRPDLFANSLDNVQQFSQNDSTQVIMEQSFQLAFVYGLCAHAMSRDQEDIQDERATDYMRTFTKSLIGVDTTPVLPPK